MITADTITDEQIRDLARKYAGNWGVTDICGEALERVVHGMLGHDFDRRQSARARCASLLNSSLNARKETP